MTANNCKTVRREMDDADHDQPLTVAANEHLHGCAECRTFHAERQSLHGLMASLETVGAPSDFDFRLRARLARDKSNAHGGGFALISRPIAVVAMVLVIAMAGLVIKSWLAANKTSATSSSLPVQANGGSNTAVATPAASSTSMPASSGGTNNGTIANLGGNGNGSGGGDDRKPSQKPKGTNNVLRLNSTVAVKHGGSAIRDSGISPAPVLVSNNKSDNNTDNKTAGSPVLVRLDPRALKISVDNGRGTSRMISLPAVSFGSQRLMARESFQARGTSAKGVW